MTDAITTHAPSTLPSTLPSATSSGRFACSDHGALADDAPVCTQCGQRPWDLDKAEHLATVSSAVLRNNKAREKRFAVLGGVLVSTVPHFLMGLLQGELWLQLSLGEGAVGAALGYGLARFLKPAPLAQLDRALKSRTVR